MLHSQGYTFTSRSTRNRLFGKLEVLLPAEGWKSVDGEFTYDAVNGSEYLDSIWTKEIGRGEITPIGIWDGEFTGFILFEEGNVIEFSIPRSILFMYSLMRS